MTAGAHHCVWAVFAGMSGIRALGVRIRDARDAGLDRPIGIGRRASQTGCLEIENPADSSAIGFARLYCANAGLSQRHGVQAQRKGGSSQTKKQNSSPTHDFF